MGRYALRVAQHALDRLRMYRTDRQWSGDDAARELQRWIDAGVQIGGQFGGQRCYLSGSLAVIVAYDDDAGPTAVTVLRRDHAIANAQIWASGKPRAGHQRSKRSDARAVRERRISDE